MSASALFYAYTHGWSDGAGTRPMSQEYDGDRAAAYADGYRDGKSDRRSAAEDAAERYGHRPATVSLAANSPGIQDSSPAISEAKARELIAEGEAAGAEYMEAVRRMWQR